MCSVSRCAVLKLRINGLNSDNYVTIIFIKLTKIEKVHSTYILPAE